MQVVGVSVDSVDKHLDFGKRYGLDFPLLSDKDGVVSNKFGSLLNLGFIGKFSNRQTYIISPEGKVEYVFTNVDSRLQEHSADVLKVLKDLKSSYNTLLRHLVHIVLHRLNNKTKSIFIFNSRQAQTKDNLQRNPKHHAFVSAVTKQWGTANERC